MKAKTFVDQVEVIVRSGKGGDGSSSMRREALVEFGGPDGGDGGRGGDVVFVASEHVNSLLSFYYDPKCFAQDGGNGQSQKMFGKRGKDLVVPVPLGTEVYDALTDLLVADITEPGQRVIVAKGGAGGYGNVHFKSSVNQAPTEHTPGGEPEERRLRLELKTIADAGLLGFPNAGKSSLLSSLSSATPKIANYPFTTLNPMVGTIVYDDFAKIAMADVPGIIEGAAKGVGLGLAFLKHLERSKVLVYVIDMAGTDNRNPWDDYSVLKKEIDEYSSELAERPFLVVANKMDEPQSAENIVRFREETGVAPIEISCASGDGLDKFKAELRKIVNPKTKFHHTHAAAPDVAEMPDTTGDEIPADALRFATFLKLEKPKEKSHPSRGNIH
ncbi:MAG: GTPase ObgE [Lentisphaerae bacterium]|jgi:GTP-binding protein|nr:GTPase ObgE [Lentisphaerota bacterium]